jgi:hypothetical protein
MQPMKQPNSEVQAHDIRTGVADFPNEKKEMTIQRFAEKHNLRISRDECGDVVVRGRLGHIYVDDGVVCAMWTDAPPMMQSRLAKLSATVWQGDIGRNSKGRRVQDAWVRGIQPDAYNLAIRLVGAKLRRVLSPAQRKALEMARLASPLTSIRTVRDGALPAQIAPEGPNPQ